MKKISFLFLVSLLILTMTNCDSDSDNVVENYSDYLTVEMQSVNETVVDTNYEILISNSSNVTFQKECKLIFSLTNISTGDYYMAEEKVINKRIASDPSLGYLNLQSGGNYIVLSDINELVWQSNTVDNLLTGEYNFRVSLIIDDPVSPYNKVHSNEITFRME